MYFAMHARFFVFLTDNLAKLASFFALTRASIGIFAHMTYVYTHTCLPSVLAIYERDRDARTHTHAHAMQLVAMLQGLTRHMWVKASPVMPLQPLSSSHFTAAMNSCGRCMTLGLLVAVVCSTNFIQRGYSDQWNRVYRTSGKVQILGDTAELSNLLRSLLHFRRQFARLRHLKREARNHAENNLVAEICFMGGVLFKRQACV